MLPHLVARGGTVEPPLLPSLPAEQRHAPVTISAPPAAATSRTHDSVTAGPRDHLLQVIRQAQLPRGHRARRETARRCGGRRPSPPGQPRSSPRRPTCWCRRCPGRQRSVSGSSRPSRARDDRQQRPRTRACGRSTSPGASSAGAAAHHPCGVINGAAASSARSRSSASRQARARIAVEGTAALTLRGRRRSATPRRAFLLDHPADRRSRT